MGIRTNILNDSGRISVSTFNHQRDIEGKIEAVELMRRVRELKEKPITERDEDEEEELEILEHYVSIRVDEDEEDD